MPLFDVVTKYNRKHKSPRCCQHKMFSGKYRVINQIFVWRNTHILIQYFKIFICMSTIYVIIFEDGPVQCTAGH